MVGEMKLALLGTGKIVKDALLALEELPQIELTAILARPHSRDKAEQLAHTYGIGKVYTDYDELLRETEADCIYVGLVNSVHYEYAARALAAGRHVIVEKPFCPTVAKTRALIRQAQARHLYLFEAVTLWHLPNFARLQECLPALGPIRIVQANYSQYSSRYEAYRHGRVLPAFDPQLYGGALYDINFYNISLVTGLFGAPREVGYAANIGPNGVDTSGIVTLGYPEFRASCTGAKDSASPGFAIIQGENGWLRVNGAPNELRSLDICAGGRQETIEANCHAHRMVHEFEDFQRVQETADYTAMLDWLEMTETVSETLGRADQSAGISRS